MRSVISTQLDLLPIESMSSDAYAWAISDSDKGQIYTKSNVVDFMISLLGLNQLNFTCDTKILEPSCGEGEFVAGLAEAIIKSGCRDVNLISGLVTAIDLVENSVKTAKERIKNIFLEYNFSIRESTQIVDSWFFVGDFLLMDIPNAYSHIIGNPPYVRIENIPKPLLDKYRRNFETMTNRSDLYIAFFERSLKLLRNEGSLSFICTDRWIKNLYGKDLRCLISKEFALDYYVDSYGSKTFESDVMTYPAITQIRRGKYRGTKLVKSPTFNSNEGTKLRTNSSKKTCDFIKDLQDNSSPWIIKRDAAYDAIKRIESQHPLIEDVGCKVFIGTATGANKVFIADSSIDVESDRLLPTVTAKEIRTGSILWNKKYIVNTYDNNGVVNLKDYPKLDKYLSNQKALLKSRHVAKMDPANWFKTIDRIFVDRALSKKLMISDIGDKPTAVIDDGVYQPNNSIYYICSNEWDLNALKCVILSQITKNFIGSYSTKIANGYMRFQAQHLRKLRLPKWESISTDMKIDLIEAGKNNRTECFDELVDKLYNS